VAVDPYSTQRALTSEIFTDRDAESQIFASALELHRKRLDGNRIGFDAMHPRENVLVFHGVGGVGKSSLSRRLENWITGRAPADDHWPAPPGVGRLLYPVRLDLERTSGHFALDDLLLNIRNRLEDARLEWTAFDLAFAVYLRVTNSRATLPTTQSGHFSKASDDVLNAVLRELGMSYGTPGIGLRAIKGIVAGLEKKQLKRSVLKDCEILATILDDLPRDSSPEAAAVLAWLLGWHLDRTDPRGRPLLVVFIDAYEELTLDSSRRAERVLNKLIHFLPQVLWVITGHNALDWTEVSVAPLLPEGSAATWPGLVPGTAAEPRQHLVGNLSDRDSRYVLERARHQVCVDLSDKLIDTIVKDSGGLPLYLELAITVARQAHADGRVVSASEVSGSLGALVARVLKGIPSDERRALRAASLVPSFDITSTGDAAGVDYGAVDRATRRPMVDKSEHNATFPFKLHEQVRVAIRNQDVNSSDAWHVRDWEISATRYCESLARRLEKSTDPVERQSITVQALHLIARTEVDGECDWVRKAVFAAPSLKALAAERPSVVYARSAEPLVTFLSCWDEGVNSDERLTRLESLADETTQLGRNAMRFRAYNLRGRNRHQEAIEIFDRLVVVEPSALNRYQQILCNAMAKRLRTALRLATALAESDPIRGARGQALVWQATGEIEKAVEASEIYERDLARRRTFRVLNEVAAGNSFRRSLLEPSEIDQARRIATEAEQRLDVANLRLAMCAEAVCLAGDARAVETITTQMAEIASQSGLAPNSWREVLPRIFDAVVRLDNELVSLLWNQVGQLERSSRMWIPIESLFAAVGRPLPTSETETEWTDSEEIVQHRWHQLALQRRDRMAAT
jgi:hypothetical protein